MNPVSFSRAQAIIDAAIAARAFPCASVEVGRADGPAWHYAAGRLAYIPSAAPATEDTVFDLASLTKVLAATTIAVTLASGRRLALDSPIRRLIPCWRNPDRAAVTVRDLLEHCSGLPAHRQYFRSLAGPSTQLRAGRTAYQSAICDEPLAYAPRTQSIYSDAGFILLGFILEDAGGAGLDVQFDAWWRTRGSDEPLRFNPPESWRTRIAPTERDPWRGRLLIGEVHDENAAALGGVAAHSGLFGTAAAVGVCARWWLRLLLGTAEAATGISSAAAEAFVRRSTVPGSSRALGWDTMLPASSCGTRLSARAVGHTGFTGTSLWLDPVMDLYVVLLAHRVHPTRDNTAIRDVRRAFHDAVVDDLQDLP